jgi:putative Mn2+ efflux pump MntP
MNLFELFLISIALAIDCFAISVCITSVAKIKKFKYAIIPLHFALFHLLMLVLGYNLGIFFKGIIQGFDHWIAFLLLSGVGIKIIIESLRRKDKKIPSLSSEGEIILFSIATSIDALIIGLTFSFASLSLSPFTTILGLTVLVLSFLGLVLGRKLNGFKIRYLDVAAGVVLVILGLKVLLGHLV